MLRSGSGSRPLARSILRLPSSNTRSTSSLAPVETRWPLVSRVCAIERRKNLAVTRHKLPTTSLQKYASSKVYVHPTPEQIAKEQEKMNTRVYERHPDKVSSVSTVRRIFHEQGEEPPEEEEEDIDMLAGVKSDLRAIKETFAFEEVPRQALIFGMAGVLPYLATSLSTVYLAWDINHASLTGQGLIFSGNTAELLLHVIEPLQIGYGAVIISFLGAIHWGFEWAKYGGVHGYPRYFHGVVAPAVAWPTILLPVEYALIAQFAAFTFLYYADAIAVTRGWAPHWYSTYRFVLTFVVGASIVLTLIGRGQIADKIGRMPGPADRVKALRDSQMESLEQEEREKRARLVEKDEAEDEEGEEEEEEEE